MCKTTAFISNNLFHIIRILELMKQPKGTNIKDICKVLHINKRSVFRLLKTIEAKFNKPFIMARASFGGAASYHLSPSFIEKFSAITFQEFSLSFTQAIFIYLVLEDILIRKDILPSGIGQLQKYLDVFFNQ